MSATAWWALVALVLPAVAGYPYARVLSLRGPLLPAGCWLVGCGVTAAGMICLGIAHVTYSRAALAGVWLVLVMVGYCLERLFGARAQRVAVAGALRDWIVDPLCLLMLAICAFQVVYTLLVAVRVPLGSFDSWALWEFKGRRFWLDGGISPGFLKDAASVFAHPAYPPLLPLLIAWVYTWCGAADPALMKPIFPLFFVALVLSFLACLELRFGKRVALLGASCLVLVPRIADYAGTGLADVPLAAYVLAASAAVLSAEDDARRPWRGYIGGGMLLGLAAFTKHDGLVFVAAGMATLLMARRPVSHVLALIGAAACVAAPWYAYVAWLHAPDRDFYPASPANLAKYADRIPGIARLFGLNMLSITEWAVLWPAAAILLIVGIAKRRVRAPWLVFAVAGPLAFYIVSLSLSAWPDYMLHARTSLDRLILVTAPFGLWLAIEQLAEPVGGGEQDSGSARSDGD